MSDVKTSHMNVRLGNNFRNDDNRHQLLSTMVRQMSRHLRHFLFLAM